MLLVLLVLRALLAIPVRQACLEWTARMVQTATMARQDRPAILAQMAQMATKVLQVLKDPRATKATKAMQV